MKTNAIIDEYEKNPKNDKTPETKLSKIIIENLKFYTKIKRNILRNINGITFMEKITKNKKHI